MFVFICSKLHALTENASEIIHSIIVFFYYRFFRYCFQLFLGILRHSLGKMGYIISLQ